MLECSTCVITHPVATLTTSAVHSVTNTAHTNLCMKTVQFVIRLDYISYSTIRPYHLDDKKTKCNFEVWLMCIIM